jgi:hypothetical protein
MIMQCIIERGYRDIRQFVGGVKQKPLGYIAGPDKGFCKVAGIGFIIAMERMTANTQSKNSVKDKKRKSFNCIWLNFENDKGF